MSSATETIGWTALTDHERADFDRNGYVVLRDVLSQEEITRARGAVRDAFTAARARRQLTSTGALHLLSAVTHVPELAFLIDHPGTFRYVWSTLGWNTHIYHSHADVHPTLAGRQPFHWHWHQDGGRQNREVDGSPRPRLSVKISYWLSDVTSSGRGNLTVVPGSHLRNRLPGPPRRDVMWASPAGAREVTVGPGDVVVHDRRLWHARSDNYSSITRMAVFFGYTYRWIAIRDDVANLPRQSWWPGLSPLQRQLLGHCGDGRGDHAWGHDPSTTPLYGELSRRGLLDSSYPHLIP